MAIMATAIGDIFKPGEEVPASGIYTVVHDSYHHENHEVTCVYGKRFPPCNHCGSHVRFKLKYMAHHISTHKQFA